MYKGTQVELPQSLTKEAYEIGKQRHLNNRSNGVGDRQVSGASYYLVEGEGVCGEFAFAQMINAPEEEWSRIRKISVTSADSQTDFGDCRFGKYNFDVKTTKYNAGHLIVSPNKLDTKIDAYALMVGFNGLYEFRGAISTDRILKEQHLFDKDHTGTLWISQEQLRDLVKT